jgi:hypothetical protein
VIKHIGCFITKNQSYIANAKQADSRYIEFQKRGPLGAVLHSIGTPQPKADPIAKYFNSPDVEASVHRVLQADGVCYQLAPDNYRMWHVGGSANNTHMGIEMTEPDCISYDEKNGYKLKIKDFDKARDHVVKTYGYAVELFAELCKTYGWNPLEDGVILSHKECYKRGIGSNHGDPEHLWDSLKTGYTMDGFREDVKAYMDGKTSTEADPEAVTYRVQVSACREKANAEIVADELKKAGFETYIVYGSGWYRVQVGAYAVKEYAEDKLVAVKKAGFDAIITTKGGETVANSATVPESAPAPEPEKKEIKVGSTVRLRKGAKDFNGGSLASFVYEWDMKVLQINCDRVVVTHKGVVIAAVRKSDLTVVD